MHTPSLTAPSMRLGAPWASLWIRRRTILILAAAILLIGSAAFSWPWLVAAGVAPFILAIAPCAAMCTVGIRMSSMGKSCSATAIPTDHAGQTETPLIRTHGQPS